MELVLVLVDAWVLLKILRIGIFIFINQIYSFTLDINECLNTTLCSPGTCNNTEGSFMCNCPTGYNGTGTIECTGIR